METFKRMLGAEHPSTLTSMTNLASTYRNQGQSKEAEELEVQVMEARKRVLGPEHPDTLTSMDNLASMYSENFPGGQGGDLSGQDYARIATELKETGNKAFKAGDFALARAKYEKGLRYAKEYMEVQEGNPKELGETLTALRITLNNNAALMCIKLSDYEGAIKAASGALAVKGASDESKAKAYFRRGQAKVYKKDEDDALEDLEQARKLMPNDAAVRKELASVKRKAAERR